MLDERDYALQDALTAAIREQIGDDPVDRQQLEELKASFSTVLENAVSPDHTVSDMAHRAQLAAAFDAVYRRVHAASRETS